MFNALRNFKDQTISFIQDKTGAVAFEYILIIGGVSAVVVGLLGGATAVFFPKILTSVCLQITTLTGITVVC